MRRLTRCVESWRHIFPGFSIAFFLSTLSDTTVQWGKVRVANGGDLIRTRVAQRGNRRERNASLVRVLDVTFLLDVSLISLFLVQTKRRR